jgi:hypothetical protein
VKIVVDGTGYLQLLEPTPNAAVMTELVTHGALGMQAKVAVVLVLLLGPVSSAVKIINGVLMEIFALMKLEIPHSIDQLLVL